MGICYAVLCAYIITAWAGLTLLILTWGQCEGLIFRISTEGTYSHVFFCFHNLIANVNGQQGSAGQAPLCVLSLKMI